MAAQMGQVDQVYQLADLPISASRASAAVDGFLGPIKPKDVEDRDLERSVTFQHRCGGDVGRVVLEVWPGEIGGRGDDLVHMRGWTMQEHLLSKQVLNFGSSWMSWQCLEDPEFG